MKLSRVDKTAIQNYDDEYLLKKGIGFYYDNDFEVALEYLRLANSMGNTDALSYIGNCYIHGKGVPEEIDLGLSYYKIAVEYNNIEAIYQLGMLYDEGEVVEKDQDLAIYYYKKAMDLLKEEEYTEWLKYPELFYTVALELLPNGRLKEDINKSYQSLMISKEGYELAINDSAFYLEKNYNNVLKQIDNKIYDEIRKMENGLGD